MADSADIEQQISEAADQAKLALLQTIKALATGQNSANYTERLSHAYALVVGALPGKLPGGYVEPTK